MLCACGSQLRFACLSMWMCGEKVEEGLGSIFILVFTRFIPKQVRTVETRVSVFFVTEKVK